MSTAAHSADNTTSDAKPANKNQIVVRLDIGAPGSIYYFLGNPNNHEPRQLRLPFATQEQINRAKYGLLPND